MPIEKDTRGYVAIIPYFNCAEYLGRAVNSLLEQTYKPSKVIIVDNASTDNSQLSSKILCASDIPIEVLPLARNFGPFVAKNIAVHHVLENTSYQNILFLDADDYLLENAVEAMSKELARHPDASAVYPHCLRVQNGNFLLFEPHPRTQKRSRKCFAGMFAHRELFKRVGFFESVRFGGDGEFHVRCLNMEGPHIFCELSAPVYFAEVREGSLTNIKGQENGHDEARSFLRIRYAESFINSKSYIGVVSLRESTPRQMCVFSRFEFSSSLKNLEILGAEAPFEIRVPLSLSEQGLCANLNTIVAKALKPKELKDWNVWTMS